MEAEIEELMRLEGQTRSELLREALRNYSGSRQLRGQPRYGRNQVRETSPGLGKVEAVAEAYPLRGLPFTLIEPTKPVSEDEWEAAR